MWHRRKILGVVEAEPFYITPEDTYHQLRQQRLGRMRKFFHIKQIPVLTRLRRHISMWNVRDELRQLVASDQLVPYEGNILFKS